MIRKLSEIRRFFAQNETPIYFVNATPFNLLGAEKWINRLHFINSIDSFAGQHRSTLVPAGAATRQFVDIEAGNQYLLQHPDVARLVQRGGKALFLMADEANERSARELGLQVCLPSARLRNRLDSKIVTTELAARAGVASVPNVLSTVRSYGELRRVASALGPDLVVQLPYGNSGKTTFFVSGERDFLQAASHIDAEPVVKVMRRIRCHPLTIEGCVTGRFTLVGPLQTELVGFSDLSPFGGGWCGNEVFSSAGSTLLTADLRARAQQATLAIGDQLRRAGYRGCFGLDYLLDLDTGVLYLGEMNPRITGATSLTSQAMVEAGSVPLLLFHLLEWFGVDCDIDAEAFNRQWLAAEQVASLSHLILDHPDRASSVVNAAPPSGIWEMQPNGTIRFGRCAFSPDAVRGDGEAFFLRTMNPGQRQGKGSNLGRIVTRGRLLTDDNQLTKRAKAWIQAFKAHVQMQVAEEVALPA